VLLTARDIKQPVEFARLLTRYGLSLRKAHAILDILAFGKSFAVELSAPDNDSLLSELTRAGVEASIIGAPEVNVRKIREGIGLSQSDFATRYPFELDTIQNWEQGRNQPDSVARTLLKIIEENPAVVEKAMTKSSAKK
jgi:DNA-binding transcriptional regulator YiaG